MSRDFGRAAGSSCVNSGWTDKQTVDQTDSFNCTGCRSFGIARGGFASCQASPLPRWSADRFGVCECPGKVCPARTCLARRSAATPACPHCQRWRQTCRDGLTGTPTCKMSEHCVAVLRCRVLEGFACITLALISAQRRGVDAEWMGE